MAVNRPTRRHIADLAKEQLKRQKTSGVRLDGEALTRRTEIRLSVGVPR
jgi:hypothetical protein